MEGKKELCVVTWNINGIRSFPSAELKPLLDSLDADIICLQETKVTRDAIDEPSALVDGYSSFFSFSRARSGYSGVATFCKAGWLPWRAEEGLTGVLVPPNCLDNLGCLGNISERLSVEEMRLLDSEGRAVITQHQLECGGQLSVINVYCPRVDPERPERLDYKLQFYSRVHARAQALRQAGSFVIVLGDVNCSHKPIDHCDPGDHEEFAANPGRQWMDSVVVTQLGGAEDQTALEFKLLDTFRHLHAEKREAFTCWNTMLGARKTNYGTRIDYILCDTTLAGRLAKCSILSEVMGSDHCPVRATFSVCCTPALRAPSLCTRYFPEFVGTQQKMHAFLQPSKPLILPPAPITGNNKPTKKRQPGIQDFFGVPKRKAVEPLDFKSQITKPSVDGVSEGECWEVLPSPPEGKKVESVSAWKAMLRGPPPAPMCDGHGEKCVLRTVKKIGPNLNRQFFCCARSEGHKSNPEARCNFFQWVPK